MWRKRTVKDALERSLTFPPWQSYKDSFLKLFTYIYFANIKLNDVCETAENFPGLIKNIQNRKCDNTINCTNFGAWREV